MLPLLRYFDTRSPREIIGISLILIVLIGVADYLSGPEISTAIFYVMPIAIAAWYGGHRLGFIISIVSAIIWLLSDATSGHLYSHPLILYWNGLARLGLFLIISYLLSNFREKLITLEHTADTDPLTGALNRRGFYERADEEILRLRRYSHPFTLAYIDLDNFKLINDKEGHIVGDNLLQTVIDVLHKYVRKTDIVARMGGDEFAVLFVETGYQTAADAFNLVLQHLSKRMAEEHWPVTFSVGMVTYESAPDNVEEMIKYADNMMYRIKKSSKNGIAHISWNGATSN